MNLSDKTAVITGAASGIGRALAVGAAARGARVVAADLNPADETVDEIRSAGGVAESVACDVSSSASVTLLAAESLERFGSVDVLAANAGIGRAGRIEECTDDDLDAIMRVNLFGTFYSVRSFAPLLRRAAAEGGEAAVLITGSEHSLGLPPNQHLAAYTTSKHALLGLADVARSDLADSGVSVTFLCPGWTLTPALIGYLDEFPDTTQEIRVQAQTTGHVAAVAWDAVESGTFLVPTNPASRDHALARVDEISEAFTRLEAAP